MILFLGLLVSWINSWHITKTSPWKSPMYTYYREEEILVFCFTQVYLLWLLMLQTSDSMMCNIFCLIFMCCFVACSHFIILWSSFFSSLMVSVCSNCFGGVQIALTLFIVLLWLIVLWLASWCNCCPLCAFMFHSVFILLFWTFVIFY